MSYLFRIMGNCLISRKSIKTSSTGITGNQKLLRIMKTDGKVLEYRSSILVKDLLVNFTGFGVGISQGSSQQILAPSYELKLGQIYYLLPCFDPVLNPPSTNVPPQVSGGVKRIKLVITKQQLQELLSKNISVDAILSGLQKGATTTTWEEEEDDHGDSVSSSSRSWKPKLETIQE